MFKKLLLIGLFFLIFIPLINAAEWDNVKNYDEEIKTVEIRNSILGIPFLQLGTVAEVQLKTEQHRIISAYNESVMEWEIYNYKEYTNYIKNIESFKDNIKGEELFINYKYKYFDENIGIHTEQRTEIRKYVNGTEYNYIYDEKVTGSWIELNEKTELPIGLIKIRVYLDSKIPYNQKIELIPTLFGVRIIEWATYEIAEEYTATPNANIQVRIEGGNHLSGHMIFSLSEDSTIAMVSIAFSSSVTPLGGNIYGFIRNATHEPGENASTLVATLTNRTANIINDTWSDWYWYNFTFSDKNASLAANKNYSLSAYGEDATNTAYWMTDSGKGDTDTWGYQQNAKAGAFSEVGDPLFKLWKDVTPPFDSAPNIAIHYPINSTNQTTSPVTANATAWDNYILTNVSLYVDGSLNQTNSSGFNNSVYTFNVDLADGTHTLYFTAYDNASQINTTETRYINIDTLSPVINITYPYGNISHHEINTNLTFNWSITEANIHSCWTNFTGTNVTLSNCTEYTNNINTTSLSNRTIMFCVNDTFGQEVCDVENWDYSIFQNSITYNEEAYNTDTEDFAVNVSSYGNEIVLGELYYNGTTYLAAKTGNNQEMVFNKTLTLNQTGNVSFYWIFDYGGNIINTSTYYQNVSSIGLSYFYNYTYCTTPIFNFTGYNEETLAAIKPFDFYGTFDFWIGDGSRTQNYSMSNASVNYAALCSTTNHTYYIDATIQYENSSFVKRSYYLTNESNLTSTQNISLYLLNDTTSTSFILDIIDENQLGISDAYIHIQRYYPGDGKYRTVEMALTDSSGSSIGHFEDETEDYRIIIELNNLIVFQTPTQKIVCKETPCTLTFQIEAEAGTTWEDFGVIDEFSWTMDYDENIWTLTYEDSSGSIGSGRLHVYYIDPQSEMIDSKVTICNSSSSLLADTLTCDITGYNGTIYAAAYLSRSPEILVYLESVVIQVLKDIFGQEGLFMSMFVLLLLAMVGLWNPAVGVILVVAGMLILSFIGLATFGAVTLWGIIFIALIILWELKS